MQTGLGNSGAQTAAELQSSQSSRCAMPTSANFKKRAVIQHPVGSDAPYYPCFGKHRYESADMRGESGNVRQIRNLISIPTEQ